MPTDTDISALLKVYAQHARDSHGHGSARAVGEVISERFQEQSDRIAQLQRELEALRTKVVDQVEATGRHEIARLKEMSDKLEAERKTWIGTIVKATISVLLILLGFLINYKAGHP